MTTDLPKVSVLVPVYNVSKYLRQCMNSLVSQSLKEVEIICVDDGSTDNSLDILKEYADMDSRIIIVSKPNGGLPSARNAALDIARGEYVGFVDSDDYTSTEMYLKMYQKALMKKSDMVICGATLSSDESGSDERLKRSLSPKKGHYPTPTSYMIFKKPGTRPFVWRMLIKRSFIESNNLRFDESIILGEDQGFQLRAYPLAKNITFISEKLYHYRWNRKNSLTSSRIYTDHTNRILAHIELIKHVGDSWIETGHLSLYKKHFFEWGIRLIYGDFVKLSLNNRIAVSKKFCEMWGNYENIGSSVRLCKDMKERFDYVNNVRNENLLSPKFTIILTIVDNDMRALEICLNSIFNQTERDVEIICFNNGFERNNLLRVQRILHEDFRISLFHGLNRKRMTCWQQGLKNSGGEYIIFMNSTDRFKQDNALSSIWNNRFGKADMIHYSIDIESDGISAVMNDYSTEINLSSGWGRFASIHQFAFKRKYILPEIDELEESYMLNEWVFLTQILKSGGIVKTLPLCIYKMHPPSHPECI